MASNMTAGGESTMKQFIHNYNTDLFTYDILFLKQIFNAPNKKLIVNEDCLLDRYMPEIRLHKIKIILSSEEYRKYKYNPKRMSYEAYGTTELWFLILHANELTSSIEFDLETPYMYDTGIVNIANRMVDLEKPYKDYSEEINKKELLSK